ncbi:MAG TPA: MFS transporter [Candidatus Binataceae bacterium]|nr:MFS transporter [Candidatus Binataceae bacterium]
MTSRERQGWLIGGCLFVSLFLLWGSGYNTAGLFIAPLLKQFGWGRTQVSLLFAVLALASGVSAPLAGRLLERVEARLIIASGAILSGVGLAAASRANSFGPMLFAYALLGLGLGLSTFVPTALVVSNWFGERRGVALGIVMGGQSLGGMVMAPAVSYAIAAWGWRAGELVLAVPMFLVVTPLVLGFVRSHPPETPRADAETQGSGRDIFADLPGLEVAEALRTRSFWMIVLAQFFFPLAGAGAFVHMVAYLIGIGYGSAAAALSLSLVLLFATIGQPLMGIVADRIGGRVSLALAFGMLAVSLVMLLAASQIAILGLFILVFGLIIAGPIVLVPLVVAESLGVRRYGSLMGLVGFPFTLGLALGPLAAGAIYDLSASYASAFELCAVISIVGVAASLVCVPAEWEKIPIAAGAAAPER